MHSALPDNDYVGPKNASKVFDEKQASFTYLSDSSVSLSSTSSQFEMVMFSKDESIICSMFSLFVAHFLPQKFFDPSLANISAGFDGLLVQMSSPSTHPQQLSNPTEDFRSKLAILICSS